MPSSLRRPGAAPSSPLRGEPGRPRERPACVILRSDPRAALGRPNVAAMRLPAAVRRARRPRWSPWPFARRVRRSSCSPTTDADQSHRVPAGDRRLAGPGLRGAGRRLPVFVVVAVLDVAVVHWAPGFDSELGRVRRDLPVQPVLAGRQRARGGGLARASSGVLGRIVVLRRRRRRHTVAAATSSSRWSSAARPWGAGVVVRAARRHVNASCAPATVALQEERARAVAAERARIARECTTWSPTPSR